jgi:hypothetical protein
VKIQIDAPGATVFRCPCGSLQRMQFRSAFSVSVELSVFQDVYFCVLGKGSSNIDWY